MHLYMKNFKLETKETFTRKVQRREVAVVLATVAQAAVVRKKQLVEKCVLCKWTEIMHKLK